MSEIIDHYVDQHAAAKADFAGAGVGWLDAERDQALNQFREHGFPGQRDEDWRYMPLRGVTSKMFEVSVGNTTKSAVARSGASAEGFAISDLDATTLVFVDGRFDPAASDSVSLDECVAGSFADTLTRDDNPDSFLAAADEAPEHGFSALNIAFSVDGYVISVKAGVKLEKPIEVLCIARSESTAAQPRNTIRIGNGSQAAVIERHVGEPGVKALVNSTLRIRLEENARLDYYLVQELDKATFQVSSTDATQAAHSFLSSVTVTLGGALVRNNLRVSLEGEGAHCDMLGLYNVLGTQHVDNHTTVVHNVPRCTSRELYRGVLDQRARGVFHGRIKVQPDAQQTDATQANNNLLLSANAEVDTKPQLEIYADDVKCAHGATVGQIDQAALFYLRSRGIDEANARSLMTFGFVNEVLGELKIEPLRASLEAALAARLIEDESLVDSGDDHE